MSALHWDPRARHSLALAAGVVAVGAAAAILLTKKSSANPYVDDPARVGRPVSTSAVAKGKAQEDAPAYDLGEEQLAVSWLSENPTISVLLLGAGGSVAHTETRIPACFLNIFGHQTVDYNLFTVPQQHASLAPVFWPRAKLLGGCTNINAMIFQNGAPSDFDEWSKVDEGASYFAWSNFKKAFQAGCQAVGMEKNEDVNGGNTLEVTKVLARPNLTAALHAQVTHHRADSLTRLRGGAVHAPHILKLSGVGPAEELKKFSIPVVKDIPGVGEGLADHPAVHATFRTRQRCDYSDRHLFSFTRIKAVAQYLAFKEGPLTSNVAETAAFICASDPKIFPSHSYKSLLDSSSGPDAPELEVFTGPFSFSRDGKPMIRHEFRTSPVCRVPTSRGSIRLKSSDPFDQTLIDPNYLATQTDAEVLTKGYKLLHRIAKTDVYKDWWVPGELDDSFETKSDAELEKLVRSRCTTLSHPMCSVRITLLENGGVLDSTFKVHGIPNLRVIDASAFPTPPGGHTTSPVYAMAEAAAEFIATEFVARGQAK